ncbi:MFS transporter [Pelagibacterales bacterium]|nr:MFS transporter [Pelagibacterales bacterium]
MSTLIKSFRVYHDKRMLRVFLLGIISGFPAVLIGAALTLWLRDNEISRSVVGGIGLITIVYTFNWMVAPIIDRTSIPILTKLVGHRKSWVLLMQFFILLCLIAWSALTPNINLLFIGIVALLIAISSAAQDITIDALRIEQFAENETKSIAAGASLNVIGWMASYKIGKMFLLLIAGNLESLGFENFWQLTFLCAGVMIVIFNIGLLFIPEESSDERHKKQMTDQKSLLKSNNASSWFISTIMSPLLSFFRKNGLKVGLSILGFLFLFKIGEAFLGRMSSVFYDDIGFSKYEIAFFSGFLGFITFSLCTLIGGWLSLRSGVIKALFISGILMASTNLMFTILAWSDKSQLLFFLAILFDDVAAAFATIAFVTFISLLVDRTYTATQYALLASIGTAGSKTLTAFSGVLVDWLNGDWGTFFIITALMVIPSLVLLWFIRKKIVLKVN